LVMMSAAPAVSQWNTPWRSAAWLTGIASSDTPEPSVILTPSLVVRRSVSLIAAVGVGMSASRNSTLRPLIPPRSLNISRAICIAVKFSVPFLVAGPVIGCSTPIRIGSCAAPGTIVASNATAPAASADHLNAWGMDLISSNRRFRPGIS
jgi:hypothetical protein